MDGGFVRVVFIMAHVMGMGRVMRVFDMAFRRRRLGGSGDRLYGRDIGHRCRDGGFSRCVFMDMIVGVMIMVVGMIVVMGMRVVLMRRMLMRMVVRVAMVMRMVVRLMAMFFTTMFLVAVFVVTMLMVVMMSLVVVDFVHGRAEFSVLIGLGGLRRIDRGALDDFALNAVAMAAAAGIAMARAATMAV
jgi:hypothetical protein